MDIEVGGLVGLLLLIANLWAILNVATSPRSILAKAIWIMLILVLPIVGLLLWLAIGPRARNATI
jgi:hypothetical protein